MINKEKALLQCRAVQQSDRLRDFLLACAGAGTGFWIECGAAPGAFCLFIYFIGKNFPCLTAGRALDFHFVQRFIAFEPRTMLI